MEIQGIINGVSDCVDAIESIVSEYTDSAQSESRFLYGCHEAFPYGLWFRGEPESFETQLTPSIFRRKSNGKYHDESDLFNYTRNRFPELGSESSPIFYLLCKMQHHFIPTRLLDWSESLLPALYFAAISGNQSRDAYLFFLNTRKLNKTTGMHDNIHNMHDDSSFGTHFRCEFVLSATADSWLSRLKDYSLPGPGKFRWDDKDLTKYVDERAEYRGTGVPIAALKDHCTPVAVFPRQSDPRMVHQRSVFTLHGGKVYNGELDNTDLIPAPGSLIDLNDSLPSEKQFMQIYRIPKESKSKILIELRVLGVHEGTLFPDIDKQAMMIKEMF